MADRNQGRWLNNKVVRAIRKMKLEGIQQALEPGIKWYHRVVWLCAFTVCLVVAVYLTIFIINDYSENPVLNSFREDESISNFPFAAITITGTTILNNDAEKNVQKLLWKEHEAFNKKTKNFQFEDKTWNPRLIDILFFTMDHMCELGGSFGTKEKIIDSEQMEDFRLRDSQEYAKHLNVTLRDNANDTALISTILPFLKNITLDCKKIVAACRWEGNPKNCRDLFVATQTDVGSGCSFNRVPDRLLRRKLGIISAFHESNFSKEEMKEWEEFDLDSIISVKGFKSSSTFQNPKIQHEAGKLTGISVMLIFDEDEGKACPIVDSRGYLIGVHSPFEEPRIMQTGITVPPKTEVFIKVRTEATVADESIRSLSIAQRKCYFQSEKPLSNFNYYTVNNCHQECLAKEIEKDCKCLLLTQSKGDNELLCGPADVGCVENTTASIRKEGFDRFCRDPVCYSPCTDLKYDPDATYLPYYEGNYFDFSSHQFLKKNYVTSIAHITQASNSVPVRERKLRYSYSVLFGVIGGTWGMIFGFTFFTIFNIVAGCVALVAPNACETNSDENTADDTHRNNNGMLALDESEFRDAVEQHIADTRETEHPDDSGSSTYNSSHKFFTIMTRSVTTQTDAEGNTGNPTNATSISGTSAQCELSEGNVTEFLSVNQGKPNAWGHVLFSRQNFGSWNAIKNQVVGLANASNLAGSVKNESFKENH